MISIPIEFIAPQLRHHKIKRRLTIAAFLAALMGCAADYPSSGLTNLATDPLTVVEIPKWRSVAPLNCREKNKHRWNGRVCDLNDGKKPTVYVPSTPKVAAPTEPKPPHLPKEPGCSDDHDCEGHDPAEDTEEERRKHHPDFQKRIEDMTDELRAFNDGERRT